MTVYHAGCEPNVMAFTEDPNTTAGKFDSNYARCSMGLDGPEGGSLEVPSIIGDNSATGWWLHFRWATLSDGPEGWVTTEKNLWDQPFFEVFDAPGGNLAASFVGVYGSDGMLVSRLYSYDSATYTESSQWQIASNTTHTIDVHCYISGDDSKLDFYIDGVLQWALTRTTDDNNGLKYVKWRCPYAGVSSVKRNYISEVIVADTDTRGWRVKTLPPTGDSATHTAWTGAYTDVDEIVPDNSGAYATALNQLETYTMGTIGSGEGIAAVAVGTLISGNGTNDAQAVIRKGGTDYVTADLGLTTGKLPYCSIWNDDPSDSQPWDAGETLSGVEFGVKSVT